MILAEMQHADMNPHSVFYCIAICFNSILRVYCWKPHDPYILLKIQALKTEGQSIKKIEADFRRSNCKYSGTNLVGKPPADAWQI